MPRLFTNLSHATLARLASTLAVLALVGYDSAFGQPMGGGPSYQRNRQGSSYDRGGQWSSGHGNNNHGNNNQGNHGQHHNGHYQKHRRHHGHQQYNPPQVSSGHFQRPYPYHLDYYRMRWGGSYAPYFGNLYGPPNVVLGAPPWYYGGGGYGGGGFFYDGNFNARNFGGGDYSYGVGPRVPIEVTPTPVE